MAIANNQSPVPVFGTVTTVPGGYTGPSVAIIMTSVTPDTETSFTITGKRIFWLTNRGSVILKYSFDAGQSGITYGSLFPGSPLSFPLGEDITVYIQAPKASQRLELVTAQ